MMTLDPMTTSDWVLLASTMGLALAAFLTPVLGEGIKSWWYAPKLHLRFDLTPPACHLTTLVVPISPAQILPQKAYYLRLQVNNAGRTQARRCEVLIEALSRMDAQGNFTPIHSYTPVSLVWGSSYDEFVDINPGRHFYCDFLSIPDQGAQDTIHNVLGQYVDWPGEPRPPLGLILSVKTAFYSQPNRLPPGRYRFVVALYSENCGTQRHTIQVEWSGEWKDTEAETFRELSTYCASHAA